jgi:hypothetical protein
MRPSLRRAHQIFERERRTNCAFARSNRIPTTKRHLPCEKVSLLAAGKQPSRRVRVGLLPFNELGVP